MNLNNTCLTKQKNKQTNMNIPYLTWHYKHFWKTDSLFKEPVRNVNRYIVKLLVFTLEKKNVSHFYHVI